MGKGINMRPECAEVSERRSVTACPAAVRLDEIKKVREWSHHVGPWGLQ